MRERDPSGQSNKMELLIPYLDSEEYQADAVRVYERDLFPYGLMEKPDNQTIEEFHKDQLPNDELLRRRLKGGNRLLRNVPELYDEMEATFMADDDESIRELIASIDLAREVYSPENERPINSIFTFLSLTSTLVSESGKVEGSGPRINAVAALVRKMYTDSFKEDQLTDVLQSAYYLSKRVDNAQTPPGERPIPHQFKIDLLGLAGDVSKRLSAVRYVERLDDDHIEYSEEDVARDGEIVKELFGELRATQRYGVKMGYVKHSATGTLIFSPVPSHEGIREHIPNFHHLMVDDHSVASVAHNRGTRHDKIKTKTTKVMDQLFMVGRLTDAEDFGSFAIGTDGELYTEADCRTRIVDIAHAHGKYAAYRRFQAEVLAHYYDATHSLDDVIAAKATIALHNTEEVDSSEPPSPMDMMGRLVIPRVRTHETQSTPTAREIIEDRPAKKVRAHGVTWHVRELPEGWHASAEARELAASLGIRLGPNETVVKSHRRGSEALGEVTAHMLIRNPAED